MFIVLHSTFEFRCVCVCMSTLVACNRFIFFLCSGLWAECLSASNELCKCMQFSRAKLFSGYFLSVCVCVCVWERERERNKEKQGAIVRMNSLVLRELCFFFFHSPMCRTIPAGINWTLNAFTRNQLLTHKWTLSQKSTNNLYAYIWWWHWFCCCASHHWHAFLCLFCVFGFVSCDI